MLTSTRALLITILTGFAVTAGTAQATPEPLAGAAPMAPRVERSPAEIALPVALALRPGPAGAPEYGIDRRRDREGRRDRITVNRRRHRAKERSEEFELEAQSAATFDRVSGLTVWGGARGSGTGDYVPELDLLSGYSWSREDWAYDGKVLQPVTPGRLLLLGVRTWNRTASHDFDERIVSDSENSLAGVFWKEDYRDWYWNAGQALLAESRLPGGSTLRASVRREEIDTVRVGTRWSIFRRDDPFRPNPAVNEGNLRAWRFDYRLDLREGASDGMAGRGFVLDLVAERAGRWGLGGDFRYDEFIAEARHFQKLGPQIRLDLRGMAGSLDVQGGPYLFPVHKQLYVGGLGTLPGYSHKAFSGDRMYLVNAEYRLGNQPAFLMFADAGDAWMHGARDAELQSDAGLGLEVADDELRIMVARRFDDPDADPVWRLRLRRTF